MRKAIFLQPLFVFGVIKKGCKKIFFSSQMRHSNLTCTLRMIGHSHWRSMDETYWRSKNIIIWNWHGISIFNISSTDSSFLNMNAMSLCSLKIKEGKVIFSLARGKLRPKRIWRQQGINLHDNTNNTKIFDVTLHIDTKIQHKIWRKLFCTFKYWLRPWSNKFLRMLR